MYSFADFETVKALPDVVTAKQLANAIGMSLSRTYEVMDEKRIPYMKYGKKKIRFKEHLLQSLSGTDVTALNAIRPLPQSPFAQTPN